MVATWVGLRLESGVVRVGSAGAGDNVPLGDVLVLEHAEALDGVVEGSEDGVGEAEEGLGEGGAGGAEGVEGAEHDGAVGDRSAEEGAGLGQGELCEDVLRDEGVKDVPAPLYHGLCALGDGELLPGDDLALVAGARPGESCHCEGTRSRREHAAVCPERKARGNENKHVGSCD